MTKGGGGGGGGGLLELWNKNLRPAFEIDVGDGVCKMPRQVAVTELICSPSAGASRRCDVAWVVALMGRRGRCALDKCYAYSSGARRRESVTEQQATEQQASREAHLNTNGRKGSSSSVRSDTQGVAGKNRGVA